MITPADQILRQALDAHRRGALDQAKLLYQRLLELQPASEVACTNLAIISAQQGDVAQADRLFRRALRANHPEGHNNLALFLLQQGRLDEAVASYRQAVALGPREAKFWYGLG